MPEYLYFMKMKMLIGSIEQNTKLRQNDLDILAFRLLEHQLQNPLTRYHSKIMISIRTVCSFASLIHKKKKKKQIMQFIHERHGFNNRKEKENEAEEKEVTEAMNLESRVDF